MSSCEITPPKQSEVLHLIRAVVVVVVVTNGKEQQLKGHPGTELGCFLFIYYVINN